MRTHIVLILLGLLPLAAVAQTPTVIARNGAFNRSEAIFNSAGEGGKGGEAGEAGRGPRAQSKIASPQMRARDDVHASPDARASHPPCDDGDDGGEMTSAMRAVLLANRPERFSEEQWLRMMQEPVNRTLFPLRVTQGMLDTLDVSKLDLRFQYMLVRDAGRR